MALNSTIFRFQIKLSEVTREVYETIELRVARHPSEADAFMLTRVIAYSLNAQEGIEFTPGISSPNDAAIYVRDLSGEILTWIDIGTPSVKRVHKASKVSKKVKIYTYRDPQITLDEMAGQEIYNREKIELLSFPPVFLSRLAETLDRDNAWEFLHDDGELSITTKGISVQGNLTVHSIK